MATTKRQAAKKSSRHRNNQETVLVLRTCNADGKSYGGFQWPEKGLVECENWNPKAECGNGLHGLLWGQGDGSLLDWSADALWYVVEVAASEVVKIDDRKVKFPRGVVLFFGDRKSATDLIASRAPHGTVIVGRMATAGDGGTATAGYNGMATAGDGGTATAGYSGMATAGDGGTATAGDCGTATAGDRGTATAGYGGTATAGYSGTATAGDCGTATAGDWGTATAGYSGMATAGYGGTATAGDRGTATAGDCGTATAGDWGTATAGDCGTATAGDGGCVSILWSNGAIYRRRIAEVGQGGIKPNRPYRLNDQGEFTEVTPK